MDVLDYFRLSNKAAIVTGGARGIGKSVAYAFASAGADVVVADIDLAEASATAQWLSDQTGRRCIAVSADVTNPEDVNELVEQTVRSFGHLDVAFCNAGICINAPAETMTISEWREVIDINLTGVFLTAQAAGRQMLKQKSGSIIATASMSAHIVNVPQPQCAYNASKAGVIQLVKSMAVEWADRGVRVNSISPGYIGTDLTLNSPSLIPLIEEWNRMAPMHRLGKPDEIQAICLYLAGNGSTFTTGADFSIDGAFTCI
jgi:NAD(P)-dependent dehydrogenase (short-subunit alcohol dehydrogenase family)